MIQNSLQHLFNNQIDNILASLDVLAGNSLIIFATSSPLVEASTNEESGSSLSGAVSNEGALALNSLATIIPLLTNLLFIFIPSLLLCLYLLLLMMSQTFCNILKTKHFFDTLFALAV